MTADSPKARRWKAPRRIRVTTAGRTYLLITVGVGIGALNTGNNLLYLVLGMLLSIIILSGILSERVVGDLTIHREMPRATFAQEPFSLVYEAKRQRGRAFALKFDEVHAGLVASAFAAIFRAPEGARATARAVAPKRGPLKLEMVRVSTLYPFGLFEKIRDVPSEQWILVWPKRVAARAPPPPHQASLRPGDTGLVRHRDGAADLAGLRELREDEDARYVHWKKSAASPTLLRTERDRDDRPQVMLSIDGGAPSDALDAECERVAAQATTLMRQGYDVGLRASGRTLRPSSGPEHERRLLSALALVGFEKVSPWS